MTPDQLARVAAIAEREVTDAATRREAARRDHPIAAALHDAFATVFGKPARIVETATGYSMGKSLPYRSDGRPLPPIPGVDR
mgnify:CR=1 FL=1